MRRESAHDTSSSSGEHGEPDAPGLATDGASDVDIGLAHYEAGRLREAEAAYRRARQASPQHAIDYLLGLIALRDGRPADAAGEFERAAASDPTQPLYWYSIGETRRLRGLFAEAVAPYERALQLKADYADAAAGLALVLAQLGKNAAALTHFRTAVEALPNRIDLRVGLGFVAQELRLFDEAATHYCEAVRLGYASDEVNSGLLMCLHYVPGVTDAAMRRAAESWGERHPPAVLRHPTARSAGDRPLRVGYVSADFRSHAVSNFLLSLFPAHDLRAVLPFCYANQTFEDEVSWKLRASVAGWRIIAGLDDESAARLIAEDEIDILVDLSGHTSRNRLPLFGRRAAPIQCTWLGYVGTTGLEAMDYIIADRHVLPPEHEGGYRERVVRLPDSYLCFAPPELRIEPGRPPSVAGAPVTFGCFNNAAKFFNPPVLECWLGILARVPGSRLFLKGIGTETPIHREIAAVFAAHGLAADRLLITGQSPREEALLAYQLVDIALDPFPYVGGTTTCEALWMGVPVITFPGDRFSGRVGASILSTIGHPELIASSLEDYTEKAVALAADARRLAALRASLRGDMARSPLCDAKRFAGAFETALLSMRQGDGMG